MLYGGNSYLTPRDDAPRVVDVYANPQESGYLHVGIARPRKMYVLYPWKGKTVLCEGAILPYYGEGGAKVRRVAGRFKTAALPEDFCVFASKLLQHGRRVIQGDAAGMRTLQEAKI